MQGLPFGVYWLVETAAPSGYRLLTEPLQFVITEKSYGDVSILRIVNVPDEDEPPGPPDTPETEPLVPPDKPDKPTPPKPPGKPPTIPETGDVEMFLLIAAGIAMVILGAWITRDTQTEKQN